MKQIILTGLVFALGTTASFSQDIGCLTSAKHMRLSNTHVSSYDSTIERGLADNFYLWDNGVTIKVKFVSGSKKLQDKVKGLAKAWEQYANIKFDFVKSSEEADIRVKLCTGEGHYSYVGMVANLIPQNVNTMSLDTVHLANDDAAWQRTVQHEFGHALGLLHEHSNPESGIQWKKKVVYKHYAKMGWSKQDVDNQVFFTYAVSYTNGSKYDNKSIMHYPIPAWQTKNGYSVDWNSSISETDASLISALYPKNGQRQNEVPRYKVFNAGKLNVVDNKAKKGLSIYPTFDISSTGKPGKVYFTVLFLDKNGYSIADAGDGNYTFKGDVAAITTANFVTNQTVSYNKGKKDLEIFIPYSEIHVPAGQHNLQLVFRVVQLTETGEEKYMHDGAPVNYQFKK